MNKRVHGLSFEAAQYVFVEPHERRSYEEESF
jgi:hypothetical protein